ncbi:MAG TPA: hypothetical protein VM122_11970, partial [Usitatibacter sp.]|nr:hypothetical protein [Usitatibacter sp.]
MQKRFDRGAALVALAAVMTMAVLRAWHCDDAFISFRAVEQLWLGHGPVFNAGERVQVFTHPLWFLVLAAWSGLGASLHPGAMVLGLLVFAAGLLALYVAFRDRLLTLAVVLAAMFFSRTVVDYATSGLETPLGFALAMAAVAGLRTGRRGLAVTALALLPLNRLDLVLWALPFAMVVPVVTWRGRLVVLAALAAPAAAWALFSTLYYGSPLPNTALAKLSGDTIGRLDQGLSYLAASLLTDPGTLALVAFGVAVGIARWRSDRLVRAGTVALLLSLVYVAWAGGDFMLGRFMLPAAWAGLVVLLAGVPAPRIYATDRRWLAALAALLALAQLVSGHSTLRLQVVAFPQPDSWGRNYHGALDERRFYLPWMGLFARTPLRDLPFVSSAPAPTDPELTWAMGAHAYLRPRDHAIVDHFALAEPFLARIRPLPGGRPGHGFRPVAESFWRWRDPAHVFGDARLDALAHDLRLAHRSPDLLSWERGAAILRLLRERRIAIDAIHVSREGEWMN